MSLVSACITGLKKRKTNKSQKDQRRKAKIKKGGRWKDERLTHGVWLKSKT